MRKMQKIAALGLAGTMALSLAACGGSGDSTADSASTAESTASSTEATAESTGSGDEAVTLNWALWDKDSTAYWQALADGYMESHPNVTIEMTDLGSTDYMTQLATQLAGGNGELLGRLDSAGTAGIACAASGKAAQGDGAKAGKPSLEDKAARDGGVETIAMVASKRSHGITPFKIDVENGAKCALDARFSRNRIEQVEAACPRDPSKEARFMPSHQACPLTCSPI